MVEDSFQKPTTDRSAAVVVYFFKANNHRSLLPLILAYVNLNGGAILAEEEG